MRNVRSRQPSRGLITLLVAMMMLLITMVLVAMAVKLSATNLAALGNVQSRAGALAAAEKVLEEVAGQGPLAPGFLQSMERQVDLNLDGISDYLVQVLPARCVRVTRAGTPLVNSVPLDDSPIDGNWITRWELGALAIDEQSGASVNATHTLRYVLTEAQKQALCTG